MHDNIFVFSVLNVTTTSGSDFVSVAVSVINSGNIIYAAKECLNSPCSAVHSQTPTEISSPYHTVTACDGITSECPY